jgi:hypothetical protein
MTLVFIPPHSRFQKHNLPTLSLISNPNNIPAAPQTTHHTSHLLHLNSTHFTPHLKPHLLHLKSPTDVKTPTKVPFFTTNHINVAHVACGFAFTLAVSSVGNAYSWGEGTYGRLGLGSEQSHSTPQQITHIRMMRQVEATAEADAEAEANEISVEATTDAVTGMETDAAVNLDTGALLDPIRPITREAVEDAFQPALEVALGRALREALEPLRDAVDDLGRAFGAPSRNLPAAPRPPVAIAATRTDAERTREAEESAARTARESQRVAQREAETAAETAARTEAQAAAEARATARSAARADASAARYAQRVAALTTEMDSLPIAELPPFCRITHAAAGALHAVLTTHNGTLLTFGKADYNGHGGGVDVLVPTELPLYSSNTSSNTATTGNFRTEHANSSGSSSSGRRNNNSIHGGQSSIPDSSSSSSSSSPSSVRVRARQVSVNSGGFHTVVLGESGEVFV